MTGVMQETRHTGAATGTYSGLQGPKLQALNFLQITALQCKQGRRGLVELFSEPSVPLSCTTIRQLYSSCQEEFMAGPLQVCSLSKYGLTELCIKLQSHVISNRRMWIL